MAQRPTTIEYTFASGSSGNLADIMGTRQKIWILSLAVRAARTNADDISWIVQKGNSVVNGGSRGGYIGPGEACVFDFGDGGALVGTWRFQGAAGDQMFLTIGVCADYFDQTDLT